MARPVRTARAAHHQLIGVLCMAVGAGLIAFALLGGALRPSDDELPLERAGTTEPTVLGVTVAPDATYPVADAATAATFAEDDGDSPTSGGTRSTPSIGGRPQPTTTTAGSGTTTTTGQSTPSTSSSTTTTSSTSSSTTTSTTTSDTTTTTASS